jgi:hypothetical protein
MIRLFTFRLQEVDTSHSWERVRPPDWIDFPGNATGGATNMHGAVELAENELLRYAISMSLTGHGCCSKKP